MPVPASAPPDLRAYLEELEKRVDTVSRVQLFKLKLLTTATLPSASDTRFQNSIALVSNPAGNKRLVFSDNTIWRYPDGTAV